MKYLILMQVDPDAMSALDEAAQQAVMEGHQQFIERTTASGEMLSTNALADPSQTVTLRGATAGAQVVEGPYAETKEFMGGYYLLDVESRDRAVELAGQLPDAAIPGMALEVRQVMFSAGPEL